MQRIATVSDTTLTINNGDKPITTQKELDTYKFSFDGSWSGFGKTAVFYTDESNVKNVPIPENGEVTIPWEVMVGNPERLFIGVFGTKGTSVKPTTIVATMLRKGSFIEGTTALTPTPNIYAQILSNYGGLSQRFDNLIATPTTVSVEEIIDARQGEESLGANLLNFKIDINDRGINLRTLGAVLDGVADDYAIVMSALSTYKNVVVPGNAIIGTSDTIVISQGQSLTGLTSNIRGYGNTAKIKYIGALNKQKAVVQIGKNAVGTEPTLDGTDIQFKNILVDCNNLAGFGVYGTYLTNETAVENITVDKSLEYGMYFAKAWYARFTKLLALNGKGQGIAFGMPLEYLDGTSVTWVTAAPLEMNNCNIEDLRAHSNGKYYSADNVGTYMPTYPERRRKGYGIGFGYGNSFNAQKFTSEGNGGVGLYVYTGSQPIKSIKSGYLENNALNSGLDPATTKPEIIIEHTNASGGSYQLRDVFVNYGSGGIYYTGVLGRRVWLKNIFEPRFLKSLDGTSANDLYGYVLKDSVYFGCGYYNTLESQAFGIGAYKTVDTRYSFTVDCIPYKGYQLIYVKGSAPWGSYTVTFEDGTTQAVNFPAEINTTDFVFSYADNKGIVSITKAGGTGGTLSNVTFKVINTRGTNL